MFDLEFYGGCHVISLCISKPFYKALLRKLPSYDLPPKFCHCHFSKQTQTGHKRVRERFQKDVYWPLDKNNLGKNGPLDDRFFASPPLVYIVEPCHGIKLFTTLLSIFMKIPRTSRFLISITRFPIDFQTYRVIPLRAMTSSRTFIWQPRIFSKNRSNRQTRKTVKERLILLNN